MSILKLYLSSSGSQHKARKSHLPNARCADSRQSRAPTRPGVSVVLLPVITAGPPGSQHGLRAVSLRGRPGVVGRGYSGGLSGQPGGGRAGL